MDPSLRTTALHYFNLHLSLLQRLLFSLVTAIFLARYNIQCIDKTDIMQKIFS